MKPPRHRKNMDCAKILTLIDLAGSRGLEIGPLTKPAVTKEFDVKSYRTPRDSGKATVPPPQAVRRWAHPRRSQRAGEGRSDLRVLRFGAGAPRRPLRLRPQTGKGRNGATTTPVRAARVVAAAVKTPWLGRQEQLAA